MTKFMFLKEIKGKKKRKKKNVTFLMYINLQFAESLEINLIKPVEQLWIVTARKWTIDVQKSTN